MGTVRSKISHKTNLFFLHKLSLHTLYNMVYLFTDKKTITSKNDTTKYLTALEAAGTSFALMMKLYHPTLDCLQKLVSDIGNLLTIALSYDAQTTPSSKCDDTSSEIISMSFLFQFKVISSSLRVFHTLLLQNCVSSKKMFSVVANLLPTLSLFSRIRCTESIDCVSNSLNTIFVTNTIQYVGELALLEQVKAILWYGLFDPEHHIAGFQKVFSRRKGSEDNTRSEDQVKKEHKNSNFRRCYQQQLFDIILKSLQIATAGISIGGVQSYLKDLESVCFIIPFLFGGYLLKTKKWETHFCEVLARTS